MLVLLKSLALLLVDIGARELTLSELISDFVDGVSGFEKIVSVFILISSTLASLSALISAFGDIWF